MFIQVITGKVVDAEAQQRAADRWERDLRPGATGFLGATEGVTGDGRFIVVARFESAEAAAANSARPEQGAWWAEMEKTVSDVEFHDCSQVVTLLGGGSDDAGFVQVMQGRIRDRAKWDALNTKTAEIETAFKKFRSDVLGEVIAVHDDGDGYTDIVYFTSEADARAGEQKEAPADVQALMGEFDAASEVTDYLDLTAPTLT